MANLRYYNKSGPFWDFITGLEDQDITNHPFFTAWMGQDHGDSAGPSNTQKTGAAGDKNEADHESTTEKDTPIDDPAEVTPEEWSPWEGNGCGSGQPRYSFWGAGRGRGGHGRGGHRFQHGPPPTAPPGEEAPAHGGYTSRFGGPPPGEEPPAHGGYTSRFGPPPPPGQEGHEHGPHHHHHGGPHGPHQRGRGGRGGRCGGRGGNRNGVPFGMSSLADFLQSQISAALTRDDSNEKSNDGDFTPAVDIFDTESSFVVHVSLPGAKKEDIAVNWDAERSELIITGVIHRPGDEEFLKTLALKERKIGAFSRKVRLGSRANPAKIDAEGITAKLEEGILRVNVPKEDKEFDVIHKVDIE